MSAAASTSGGSNNAPLTLSEKRHLVRELEAKLHVICRRTEAKKLQARPADITSKDQLAKMRAAAELVKQLDTESSYLSQQLTSLCKEVDADEKAAATSGCKRARDSESNSDIILVQSGSLNAVLVQMLASSAPATYDFQGLEMTMNRFQLRGGPLSKITIASSNVTWRNGVVSLIDMTLIITGTGVAFESLIFNHGHFRGVTVSGGGGLTMTDCEFHKARDGVVLEGNSSLVAAHLKMTTGQRANISLRGSSTAQLSDCDLNGGVQCSRGIDMEENSSMVGERVSITCSRSSLFPAVQLKGKASMCLTDSSLSVRPMRDTVDLKDESTLQLTNCKAPGNMKVADGATLIVKD